MKNKLYNHIIKNDLSSFIMKSFYTTNPNSQYLHNWHIDLIANIINNVNNDKKVIINIPPRYLKSVCLSVAWPAWILGHDPSKKIIVVSYSLKLSEKHSQDTRLIMNSKWYKKIFPKTRIVNGENKKDKFVTTKRGFRFATSINGTLTGEGADIIIVDDPHNPNNINSTTNRNSVIDWFNQVLLSRLNNKKTGVILVVMQRLHIKDLSGYLINKNSGWKVFSIPVIMNKQYKYIAGNYEITRHKNSILHDERENYQDLEKIRKDMGSILFNAQYMQLPQSNNNIININDFMKFNNLPTNHKMIVQSCDTSFKNNEDSDYSVITTWYIFNNGYYLVDLYKSKLEFNPLYQKIVDLASQYNPDYILIEDKASGQSIIQSLNNQTNLPVIAIIPKYDKMTRLMQVINIIESKKIFIPKNANWVNDLLEELALFPNSKHDDQVDSITQFLNWIKSYKHSFNIRKL